MKIYLTLAMLLSSAVLSLWSVPCAALTVTYQSEYYQTGNGAITRIPRNSGGGAFELILGDSYTQTVSPSSNNTLTISLGALTIPANGQTYPLAFTTITGTAAGGMVIFPPYQLVNGDNYTVPTGTQDITVTNVYFPVGGGGPCTQSPCPTAAGIDEFNETLGSLADDLFVSVYQPQSATTANAGLTQSGNYEGSVSTTSQGVRINADQGPASVSNGETIAGLTFDRWIAGPGSSGWTIASDGNDLDVNGQTDVDALALYHAACPSGFQWTSTSTVSQCVALPQCPDGEIWFPGAVPGHPGLTVGRCIAPPRVHGCGSCPEGYKCSATLNDPPVPICIPQGTNPPAWPGGFPTPSARVSPR